MKIKKKTYHSFSISDSEDRQAEMVIRPKTIKDIQSNTRLLNALNKNHKDDIFVGKKSKHIGTEKVNTYVIPIYTFA